MIVQLPVLHQNLTPEVAASHSRMPQIKGDRALMKSRVRNLAEANARGLFYSPEWATCFCRETETLYRINGKHSSHYLTTCNGDFPKGLTVTIKQFECDTLLELAELFDEFDKPTSARTRLESLNVHKSLDESLRNVSRTNVGKILAGVTWYLRNTTDCTFTFSDQKQLIHQYGEFIAWADSYVSTRRMSRCGVMAAVFATYAVSQFEAAAFWSAVKDQTHEDCKHPSRVLGRFLEVSQYSKLDTATKKPWDTRAFYVKSIHGWNAARGGTTTDLKYHHASPLPKVK